MYQITVKIKSKKGSNFGLHKVICLFAEQFSSGIDEGNGNNLGTPGYRAASLEPTGDAAVWTATLFLPDRSLVEDLVTVKLIAPDGSVLREQRHELGRESSVVEIEAEPAIYQPLVSRETSNSLAKIRGRVIDLAGRLVLSGEQVILFAKGESGIDEIVAVARTDSQGYFSFQFPNRTFIRVFAKVGDYPEEEVLLEDGELPEQMIVAVFAQLEEGFEKNDCSCETPVPALPDAQDILSSPQTYMSDASGGCVSFTKPNRTIEEFDFFGVVRTTEPEIVGLTLPEPNFISAEKIPQYANPTGHGGRPSLPVSTDKPAAPPFQSDRPVSAPDKPVHGGTQAPKDTAGGTPGTRPVSRAGMAADLNPMPAPTLVVEHTPQSGAESTRKIIDPRILKRLSKGRGYSEEVVSEAARETEQSQIDKIVARASRSAAGRSELSVDNPLDWDEDPTFYQAATIAHGHILHYKQTWRANGFSLGDLLYSLPLAPGQKRQVAILDWERREIASRSESLEMEERLAANLTRDRDIQEIVTASLKETDVGASLSLTGGSSSNEGSSGFGSGAASALMMVAGSASGARGGASVGFQHGSRQASANSLQQIRDRISQAASALRSQRSTVVQSVAQGETLRAQTEAIANYNHCHAITVEYFEVLRHFAVEHKLVDVQECLFVPLLMSPFDPKKVLRWRQALERGIRDKRLIPAFNALERIVNSYDGADLPAGSYADEPISRIEGLLRVSFRIVRPSDKDVAGQSTIDGAAWTGLAKLLGKSVEGFYENYLAEAKDKDRVFVEQLGPQIARELIDRIELVLLGDSDFAVPLQFELISDFKDRTPLQIKVRSNGRLSPLLTRRKVADVQLRVRGMTANVALEQELPPGTKMTLDFAQLRYETQHLHFDLVSSGRVSQNLIDSDGTTISCPLVPAELRNPRNEDRERANALLAHLHDNMEHYHRIIWTRMDPSRRFMLLDGIVAPNGGGRSVASIVENRLIGIVGNSMILPVVPGVKLDPLYQQSAGDTSVTLLDAYMPDAPTPPLLVSVPTRGVYAESVIGACNSCEKKDETRFWRWEESPLPDQPTPIGLLSSDSRATTSPDLTAKDFAAPIINLQNSPAAPDPTGLAAILQLAGKGDSFRDLTGLSQNQLNSSQALQTASAAARDASRLALQQAMMRDIGQIEDHVKSAVDRGILSPDKGEAILEGSYQAMYGDGVGDDQTEKLPVRELEVLRREQPGELIYEDKNRKISIGNNILGQNQSKKSGFAKAVSVDASKDSRAFFPGTTQTLSILKIVDLPADATVTWSVKPGDVLSDLEGLVMRSTMPKDVIHVGQVSLDETGDTMCIARAGTPGRVVVTAEIEDGHGADLATFEIEMCVPQFVSINDSPEFDTFLSEFPSSLLPLRDFKETLVEDMVDVARDLLRDINVRLICTMAPFSQNFDALLDEVTGRTRMITATIRNTSPRIAISGAEYPVDCLAGYSTPVSPSGAPLPWSENQTIDIFPGSIIITRPAGVTFKADTSDKLSAMAESIGKLGLSPGTSDYTDIMTNTARIVGRICGETLAHEIIHWLCGPLPVGKVFKAHSEIKGDLMQDSPFKTFERQAGIKIKKSADFPKTGSFTFTKVNQIAPATLLVAQRFWPKKLPPVKKTK
ncbi:MAG: hypothetical protein KC777_15420 [Cyanobacteria bacterium HKST-UBA02]|nr:hypothetical protein [Cyanobacteria bacterium HKST-UBA02]